MCLRRCRAEVDRGADDNRVRFDEFLHHALEGRVFEDAVPVLRLFAAAAGDARLDGPFGEGDEFGFESFFRETIERQVDRGGRCFLRVGGSRRFLGFSWPESMRLEDEGECANCYGCDSSQAASNRLPARSMSSSVVSNPRLKRIVPRASSSGRPIALCVGLSRWREPSKCPKVAAQSSVARRRRSWTFTSGRFTLSVFGRRSTRPALTLIAGPMILLSRRGEPVSEHREALHCRKGLFGGHGGVSQADNAGHVRRSAADAVFFAAPADEALQDEPPADIEGAYPLGTTQLMSADRKEIHPQRFDAGDDLSGRLGGVGMEEDSVLMAAAGNLLKGLDGSDFVIGVHDAGEHGIGANCGCNRIGIDHPLGVAPDDREFVAQVVPRTGPFPSRPGARLRRTMRWPVAAGARRNIVPQMARLAPSVPPEVKTISSRPAPSN